MITASIASRKPCTQSSVSFDNGIKYSCDRALDGMSSHSGLIAPYFTMTSGMSNICKLDYLIIQM